jgi:hypothetical protein
LYAKEAAMPATLDLPFQLGDARSHEGVTLVPLFPLRGPVCDYTALDDAMARGFQVQEVDAAGLVGQFAVANPLEQGVLLYDGQELVGAKQNRILNITVLVAAGVSVRVPVSCVERGRWAHRGGFTSAGHVASPELRCSKASALAADALAVGAAQQVVWQTVDLQLAARGVRSLTAASADGFAAGRERRSHLAGHFALEPGQCGALVSIGGAWCLDAVSRPDVFAALYPQLLAGYLYDALDPTGKPVDPETVMARLSSAVVHRRPSAGLGDDLRVESGGVVGCGLAVDGELVQLSAYGDPSRQ